MQPMPTYSHLMWYCRQSGLSARYVRISTHHPNSAILKKVTDRMSECSQQSEEYRNFNTADDFKIPSHGASQTSNQRVDQLHTYRNVLSQWQNKTTKGGFISDIGRRSAGYSCNVHGLLSAAASGGGVVQTCGFHTGCELNFKQTNKGTSAEFHRNPIDELQKYLSVPIIPESHRVFSPADDEMEAAEKLFVDSDGSEVRRLAKAIHEDFWPESKSPEVLFMGRSNVGKSSLLKALLKKAPIALKKIQTSQSPGHTRSLQFFDVNKRFTLVDAPGYGFNMPPNYHISVETYLKNRKNLCRSLVLIDGEIGINNTDFVGLEMMEEYRVPYVIVVTKVDKVKNSKLVRTLASIVEYRDQHTLCCLPQPFFVSSQSGAGLQLLKTFIGYVTGCIEIKFQ